jgi:hypothetical protein
LTVTRPEGYVGSPDVPYISPDLSIGREARDIRYLKTEIGNLTPTGRVLLLTPAYMAVNATPLCVLAGVLLMRRRREKLTADIGYTRARRAGKMAKKRLSRARSLAAVETSAEFFAELHLALAAYLADKMNVSRHGLTTDGIKDLLTERDAPVELVADVSEMMRQCDYARFASSSITREEIDKALGDMEQIMTGMEGVNFG